jgi:DNA-directed RNA polymerase specialized sigma24 family protein
MRETITMTTVEQRRAWVLTKVMGGEVEVGEAAELLGLSVRSVWRLKRRFADCLTIAPIGDDRDARPRPCGTVTA